MKKIFTVFLMFYGVYVVHAQSNTNTFPLNGNVGIGTITPTNMLQVKANEQKGEICIGGGNGIGSGRLFIHADLVNDFSYIDVFGDNVYKKLNIDASHLILNAFSKGNVGIGTTAPNEKLAVNGNIRAKEIKVEMANWPDYVFEEKHEILSLDSVAAFIRKNKRLPEMPAAEELEKNGISVGDMLKLQQKKIEELTLHLIEKDKDIQLLKVLTEEQHKQIKSILNTLKKEK